MTRKSPAPVIETPVVEAPIRQQPLAAITWFESTNAETAAFDVMGIRPIRNFSNGRLEWEVPTQDAARFATNHFCLMGRVRPKG